MLEIFGLMMFFLAAFTALIVWQQKVMKESGKSFLELAALKMEKYEETSKGQHLLGERTLQDLVHPLKESLSRFEGQIHEMERNRLSAYTSLTENLKFLSTNQLTLEKETKNLVKALRTPHVRGLWGEIQLKRVVELAGMIEYCDFVQQEVLEGSRLRPDMIIRLPGEKSLVVDSKTPLSAYLEAIEATDEEEKILKLKEHARQIRTHITQLSLKSYHSQLKVSPEFVILFIPGEPLFSAALEHDPSLLEFSSKNDVILATPSTLIAVLRAVAHSWRHEQVAKNALMITELGKSLHERLGIFVDHFQDIKKGLDRTIESYNKSLSSLENRVLVPARKLKELAAQNAEELPTLASIEKIPVNSLASHEEKELIQG